jgi:hypothetical protein
MGDRLAAADGGGAEGADGAAGGAGGDLWVMCCFIHRYLEFRRPEVESLAELAGYGGQLAWCVRCAVHAMREKSAAVERRACACACPCWRCALCEACRSA